MTIEITILALNLRDLGTETVEYSCARKIRVCPNLEFPITQVNSATEIYVL